MKHVTKLARKVAVLMVGLPLLVLGLILIPLPGPGVLVCFAALFILSLEFEMPRRHLERLRRQVDGIIGKARQRQADIHRKYQDDEK